MKRNFFLAASGKSIIGNQADINVFLFGASQSNMNGQGAVADITGGPYASYLGAKPNVQLYGALTGGIFQNYEAGVNARTTVYPGLDFGPEGPFLQDVQASIGGIVHGIKYCTGGVGLHQEASESDWSPSSSNDLYELFFKNNTNDSYCELALNILLNKYPYSTIKIKGLICANGERDAQFARTTFEADFKAITDQLKIDLPTYSNRIDVSGLKIVYNRLKPSILPNAPDVDTQRIRAAQESFAANNADADYVNSDDLPFNSSNIHYTSDSVIILGQRLAAQYLSY